MYDIRLLSLSHRRPIAIYYVLSSNPPDAKFHFQCINYVTHKMVEHR